MSIGSRQVNGCCNPLAVKPIFKEKSGELFGLLATTPDGSQFLVSVDEQNPSRLRLKCTKDGRLYALETTGKEVGKN